MYVRCTERKGTGFKPCVQVSAVWTYVQYSASCPWDLCQQVARMNKDGSELAIRRANKSGTHHRLLLCMEQTKTTSLSGIPHIFLDRWGGDSVRFSWEDKFLTITFSICISGLVMKTSAARTCQIIAKMPALHHTCCGDHHPLSIFLPAPPHPNLRLGVVAGRGSLG